MRNALVDDKTLPLYDQSDVAMFGCPLCECSDASYRVVDVWEVAGNPIVQVLVHLDAECSGRFRQRCDAMFCLESPRTHPCGICSSRDFDHPDDAELPRPTPPRSSRHRHTGSPPKVPAVLDD